MIVPDVNVLLHAYDMESPKYEVAKAWLEGLLSSKRPVGFSWVTMIGFIRIVTNPRITKNPLPVDVACAHVRKWLEQPYSFVLDPSTRHAELLFGLLEGVGTAGNLTTDAHIAALAIDNKAEVHSTDADFGRFKGLRWVNPLD